MPHCYPTRFQARIQAKKIQEERCRAEEAALVRTVKYTEEMLHAIESEPTFFERVRLLCQLYHHFYDVPLLLTNHERFRAAAWDKMNEQEAVLLNHLRILPARITETTTYDMRLRGIIYHCLDLMEKVRTKYW